MLGRDVADLAAIRSLRLHYGDILNNISLDAEYQVLSVSIIANGLPVVEATNLGSPTAPDGSGFEMVDLASYFAEAPDKYTTALKERARARRGQVTGSGSSAVEL